MSEHVEQRAPAHASDAVADAAGDSGLSPVVARVGRMDWLARVVARTMMKLPRYAPSRWRQKRNRRYAADLPADTFDARTPDGLRLEAVRYRAADSIAPPAIAPTPDARRATADSAGPVPILFAHGWTETKEFHHRLARLLTGAGHDVIMFDHRAHGRSGGKRSTFSVQERDDLRAVVEQSADRGWIGDRLIVMGVSMGAATVLRYAAQDRRVAGVVAYAPFATFEDAIRSYHRRYARWLSADWAVRGFHQAARKAGFDLREASPLESVAAIDAPILFIVGRSDRNLPGADHASRLHRAVRDPTRSRLIEVPEANHFNIVMRTWPQADEAVLAFCGEIAGESAP